MNTQRIGTNGGFFRYNVQTSNEGIGRYWLNLLNNILFFKAAL
jgi:hypothetical protein